MSGYGLELRESATTRCDVHGYPLTYSPTHTDGASVCAHTYVLTHSDMRACVRVGRRAGGRIPTDSDIPMQMSAPVPRF